MVRRILDVVHERFEEMVTARSAPDDEVLYDAAVLTARYNGEVTTVLTLYISIACPEHGPRAFATCSSFCPIDVVLEPSRESLDEFLDSTWNTLVTSRTELDLESMEP